MNPLLVDALRPVQDPELHRSIVDLGMLRRAELAVGDPAERRRLGSLPLWPTLLVLLVFYVAPYLVMGLRSVTDPPGAVLANYEQFFAQEAYVRVLTNTFWIALLATIACLIVGYPFAYLMTIVPGRLSRYLHTRPPRAPVMGGSEASASARSSPFASSTTTIRPPSPARSCSFALSSSIP